MGSINIPLSHEDEAILKTLADTRKASDAEIAATALHGYLRFEAAQVAKIQAGIVQADRGEFLDDAAADAFFARYGASD
jgi:predicted transcriptional regulator